MQTFLQLFGQKNSTLQEEALMAVGAVASGEAAKLRLTARTAPTTVHSLHKCAADMISCALYPCAVPPLYSPCGCARACCAVRSCTPAPQRRRRTLKSTCR